MRNDLLGELPHGRGIEVRKAGIDRRRGQEIERGDGVRGVAAAEAPEQTALGEFAGVADRAGAAEAGLEFDAAHAEGAQLRHARVHHGLLEHLVVSVDLLGRQRELTSPGGDERLFPGVHRHGHALEHLFGAEVEVEIAAGVEVIARRGERARRLGIQRWRRGGRGCGDGFLFATGEGAEKHDGQRDDGPREGIEFTPAILGASPFDEKRFP